ncbi:MAG: DinB family protein [Planctomycetota bacterium]
MGRKSDHPVLAPPGAGLPWSQALMGRYFLLPYFCLTHSWDGAQRVFQREGRRVLDLAEPLTGDELATRVLVYGVIGIEDSSRYWSVALALEHLIIVGEIMAEIVVALSHDQAPSARVDIAGVKPPGKLPAAEAIQAYRSLLARYQRRMREEIGERRSRRLLDHPWFGEINVHQWHCLAAMHQRIHRRQIEAIVKCLHRGTGFPL